ncbi:MAG: hypothetical protein WBD37_13240 [Anderseniella sp.]
MTRLSKILIVGLVAATSITASVAAASLVKSPETSFGSKVTIIHKSDSQWPVQGLISVDVCKLNTCIEA